MLHNDKISWQWREGPSTAVTSTFPLQRDLKCDAFSHFLALSFSDSVAEMLKKCIWRTNSWIDLFIYNDVWPKRINLYCSIYFVIYSSTCNALNDFSLGIDQTHGEASTESVDSTKRDCQELSLFVCSGTWLPGRGPHPFQSIGRMVFRPGPVWGQRSDPARYRQTFFKSQAENTTGWSSAFNSEMFPRCISFLKMFIASQSSSFSSCPSPFYELLTCDFSQNSP